MEQSIQVIYRYHKNFIGQIKAGYKLFTDTYDFYVKNPDINVAKNLVQAEEDLKEEGILITPSDHAMVSGIRANNLFEFLYHKMREDHYYLLDKDKIKNLLKSKYLSKLYENHFSSYCDDPISCYLVRYL